MSFNRQLFKEGYKAGYKKAKRMLKEGIIPTSLIYLNFELRIADGDEVNTKSIGNLLRNKIWKNLLTAFARFFNDLGEPRKHQVHKEVLNYLNGFPVIVSNEREDESSGDVTFNLLIPVFSYEGIKPDEKIENNVKEVAYYVKDIANKKFYKHFARSASEYGIEVMDISTKIKDISEIQQTIRQFY